MDTLLDGACQAVSSGPAPLPQAPFPHGPFLVAPDGALHPRGRPALRFTWRGRPCEARIDVGRVALSVEAGAVPYTAVRPADRPAAFAELARLRAGLPPGWRLHLLADHRIRLEKERPLRDPAQAVGLVAALVGFALDLDPYLDRLEAVGAG